MADRVAGDQFTDTPTVMRWDGSKDSRNVLLAWIGVNGGEARYEPASRIFNGTPAIAVRTATGWDYVSPGEGLEMTDEWFDLPIEHTGRRHLRAFRPVPAEGEQR